MMRWVFGSLVLLTLAVAARPAQAALTLELVPAGAGVNQVHLSGYEDFASYQIEVLLSAAGLDKSMVQADQPLIVDYVFAENDPGYPSFTTALFDSSNDSTLGAGEVRVVFSDFYTGPASSGSVTWVDATSPTGIGVITIDPSILNATMRFLPDGLILANPNGDPIAGFNELVNNLNPVPEPGSFALVLSGAALAGAFSLRRKRSAR
jgi:hypothetical protein